MGEVSDTSVLFNDSKNLIRLDQKLEHMKKIALSLLIVFCFYQGFTQEYSVPKDYAFESKEDYTRYQQAVLDGIDWLIETPVAEEPAKRKEINAFVLEWLTGSPTVTIELSEDIVTFMDCPDCLMIFMGGWTKYTLEQEDKNKIQGNLAGIKTLIRFYENNKTELGRSSAIEKYSKLLKKDKLEDYITKRV